MFDCGKCKYHAKPSPVKVEKLTGVMNSTGITGTKVMMSITISSAHTCSLYGFKKTSLVFNWPRCQKHRTTSSS